MTSKGSGSRNKRKGERQRNYRGIKKIDLEAPPRCGNSDRAWSSCALYPTVTLGKSFLASIKSREGLDISQFPLIP